MSDNRNSVKQRIRGESGPGGRLPDGSGLDVQRHAGDAACVFISGVHDPMTVIDAMKHGAADFVLKDDGRKYLAAIPAIVGRVLKQRASEQELAMYREHLEELVAERSAQLETERRQAEQKRLALERDLQHAKKLESLGTLAGGIAHDFNNLLAAILGNAELALADLALDEPAREALTDITKAAQRAAELARQMLAYSGKGRFVTERVDVSALVGEMTHLIAALIPENVVIEYKLAADIPAVGADAAQLRQVVMSLVTNAAEAIGDESGIITLSTGAADCDAECLQNVVLHSRLGLDEPLVEGQYAYLDVADTGCGMDADTLEKLFDPFYTTKFTGRGLGLSAVLGIVRGHRGAIVLSTELGEHSTFRILLPAVAGADEPSPS